MVSRSTATALYEVVLHGQAMFARGVVVAAFIAVGVAHLCLACGKPPVCPQGDRRKLS